MSNKTLVIVGIVAVVAIAAVAIGFGFKGDNNQDEVTTGVNYYGNGGLTSDGKAVFGLTSHTVFQNLFTKDDARFDSWNTKSDGTGTTYHPGDNIDYRDGSSVRLYAIWDTGAYLTCTGIADNITLTYNGQTLSLLGSIKLPASGEAVITVTYKNVEGKVVKLTDTMLGQMVIDGDKVYVKTNSISSTGGTSSTLSTDGTTGTLTIAYDGSQDVQVSAGISSSMTVDKGVHYKGNGGTYSSSDYYCVDGSTVSTNKFTNSGKTFVSWNTKADGTGTAYKPGDTIEYYGYTVLYAQWA